MLCTDAIATFAEPDHRSLASTYLVDMIRPPAGASSVLFFPGSLLRADRDVVLWSGRVSGPDEVAVGGNSSRGRYSATVRESVATADELRAAERVYPPWLESDRRPAPGYRTPAAMNQVADLARRLAARDTNPYDAAVSVESYLRSNFTYTLNPPAAAGDPELQFLFTSRQGYCQYFAVAMGDMLRGLGIPARLVNGYGPGTYDAGRRRWVVREADAHTWVEAFFPRYGWIPFEPTPDGVYQPIPRGLPDAGVGAPATLPDQAAEPGRAGAGPTSGHDQGPGRGSAAGRVTLTALALPAGAALSLLLLTGLALYLALMRYLWPRRTGTIWRRAARISGLAGMPVMSGETPHEFGSRLARLFPEAAEPSRRLADAFMVAAYAPVARAVEAGETVRAAWEELLPLLLRRAARRGLGHRPAAG